MLSDPAVWLLGTWRSDKGRTLKEWLYAPRTKKAMRAFLERDLGKLIHRFTAKRSYTYSWFEDKWFRSSYEVRWKNSESLFLVGSTPGEEEQGLHLHFISPDCYWMHAGKNIEYFSRLPSGEAPPLYRRQPHRTVQSADA